MDDALRDRLSNIIQLAYKQDWSDKSFSLEKAHICSELSSIVYEDVQEYELKKASRIHLFASDSYKKIINSGKANSILSSFTDTNLEAEFFVLRSRYAVLLGTCFNDVVILTVRGTVFRKLWDWKANVDTKKYHIKNGSWFHPFHEVNYEFDDQFFHRGFFESIAPQLPSIYDEISKHFPVNKDVKIIWTGHSLGGAMAAIGNVLSQANIRCSGKSIQGKVVGAYTFGMPRYCGLGITCSFPNPHHIYKKNDIVPTVPTRKMGFSDSCTEYEISDNGRIVLSERTDTFGVVGHIPKLLSSLQAHSIEGYVNSLANALNIPRA